MTPTLQQAAVEPLKQHHQTGLVLDVFLRGKPTIVTPPCDGSPSIWVFVGSTLFTERDGSDPKKLKPHQIGVAFYWPDGRSEHAVFDAHQLWDKYVDPRETQLKLWPEL